MKETVQKIVYIEDDTHSRLAVHNVLKRSPFQNFIIPGNTEECLQALDSDNVYAFLIDLNLTHWMDPLKRSAKAEKRNFFDGVDLAAYLKDKHPNTHIKLFSANHTGLIGRLRESKLFDDLEILEMKNWSGPNPYGFLSDYLESIFKHPLYVRQPELRKKVIIDPSTKISVVNGWDDLITSITEDDKLLYDLNWQKFEDLIGHLLEKSGWKVTPVGRSKDGGIDLIASQTLDPGIPMQMMIQCKKYHKNHKVGVEVLKEVWTTKWENGFHQAMVVTTSFFTKGAKEKADKWNLFLRDHDNILEWCKQKRR